MLQHSIVEPSPELHKQLDLALSGTQVELTTLSLAEVQTLIDILQHKLLDQSQSLSRYRNFYEFAPMGIMVIASDGMIVESNQSFESLLQKPKPALRGTNVAELVMPDYRNQFQAFLQALRDGTSIPTCEIDLNIESNRLTGTHVWVSLQGKSVEFAGKQEFLITAVDITEQRQTTAELAASEAHLRIISEMTSDFAFSLKVMPDQSLQREWITQPAFQEITGFTPDESASRGGWMSLPHPEDLPEIGKELQLLLAGKPFSMVEFRAINKHGEVRYISALNRSIKDENGQVKYIYGANKDITETKLAQQALKVSEERFRTFVNSSLVGIFLLDDNHNVVFANQRLSTIMGYAIDELTGGSFAKLVSKDEINRLLEIYHEPEKTERAPEDYEFSAVCKNGSTCRLDIHIITAQLADSKTQKWGQVLDITERKRAEEELRRSESILRSILDNTDLSYVLMDAQHRVITVNKTAQIGANAIFERNINRGDSFAEFLADWNRESYYQNFNIALNGKAISSERSFILPDGTSKYFKFRYFPAVDPDGIVLGICLSSEDITKQKQVESELRESDERYRTLIQQFPMGAVYQFDHDLRFQIAGGVGIPNSADYGSPLEGKTIWESLPVLTHSTVEKICRTVLNGEIVVSELEYADLTFAIHGTPIKNSLGEIVSGLVVMQNVTERKRAEETLRKLNRTLALTTEVNQVIVRAGTIPELFERICKIAVERGGFRMAWIGKFDRISKQVKPIASAGWIDDYLETINIVVDGSWTGKGPTGVAVNTGQHAFAEDIEHDVAMEPWRDRALRLGFRALAAFPLKVAGETRAVFSIYAHKPNLFDSEEIALLDEMATNISFAMEFAEQELQRQHAEAELRRHVRVIEEMQVFLQTTLDAFPANTVVLNSDGTIINTNLPWDRFAGGMETSTNKRFIGTNYLDAIENGSTVDSVSEVKTAAEAIRVVIQGQKAESELDYPCDTPSGRQWFTMRVTPFPEPPPRRVVVAHINNTLRMQAEERFEIVFQSSPIGISISTLSNGRFIDANAAFVKMYGFETKEELIGSTSAELGTWNDIDDRKIVVQLLRDGKLNEPFTFEFRHQSGNRLNAQCTLAIMELNGEEYLLSMIQDRTTQREAEIELEQYRQNLEDLVYRRTNELELLNQELQREVIERKTAENAERDQRIIVEALRSIAVTLNKQMDLDVILDEIMSNIKHISAYDTASIILVKDDKFQVVRSDGESERDKYPIDLGGSVDEMTILSALFRSQESVMISDTLLGQLTVLPMPTTIRSYIGATLVYLGEVIGFINLGSKTPFYFTEESLFRVNMFAEQATIAIQNARLYLHIGEMAAWRERRRIGRELHDAVTQTIFSASIIAETLSRLWESDPSKVRDGLHQLQILIRSAAAETRNLLFELRPEATEDVSLNRLIGLLANAFEGRTEIRPTINVPELIKLSQETKSTLYWIVHEALNNIAKHAKATMVDIALTYRNESFILTIKDNGRGFDPSSTIGGHLGLKIMQERAESIRATVQVLSQISQGTTISVEWKGTIDD